MSINSGILKETNDKNLEKIKKRESEINNEKNEINKKQKEKIEVLEKAEDNLYELKQILDKGLLNAKTEDLIENLVDFEIVSQNEIEEIFDKIEEIENIKDVDKILPKSLRITKEEYKKAIIDDDFRKQILQKVNLSLSLIVRKIKPNSGLGISIYGGFLYAIDKKLLKVQENSIDIKKSLNSIDKKKKYEKIKNLSFFQKLILFVKEVFNNK